MAVGISLVFWAGWHNLRSRRLALQKQQEERPVALPDMPMNPSDATMDTSSGAPLPLRHKIAPAFTLESITGSKVSLSDYKGRPIVVNFWATWCGPCKVEMPWFEEFRKKYAADGFEVLGLADDSDAGKAVISASAQKLGVTYPILLTDAKVQTAYLSDTEVLPISFYVDRNGIVSEVTAGLGSKDELEAQVKAVIAIPAGKK